MAYRCMKYDKILVGPKKPCEKCEESDLESECGYRVWQNGILKEGGKRTRGKWVFLKRRISCYELGDDGMYHYRGGLPEEDALPILEILTKDEMEFVGKHMLNYYRLLVGKGLVDEP